jgi:hypothetical protein
MERLEINKEEKKLKREVFSLWKEIHPKIREKFNNLNGKTSQYDVPDELFQKRTSRKNRVLIPWKIIEKNNITLEQLKTFYGGVCVEFVNCDFFDQKYKNNKLHGYLKDKLGADDKIASIISFRTEDGDAGAAIPRKCFEKFKKEDNLNSYIPIDRKVDIEYSGIGDNSVWEGNIYYSIKGGEQISLLSHKDIKPQLFNPAIDYANERVCFDIDMTMSYFALHCYDIDEKYRDKVKDLKEKIKKYLETRDYDEGNLYKYCEHHPSLAWGEGYLIDAIQLEKISIHNFETSSKEESSVICHNEAANKEIFYFDKKNNYILSPARPTNLFWATHLSNMMQQNYNLEEFFEMENERVKKREKLLKSLK